MSCSAVRYEDLLCIIDGDPTVQPTVTAHVSSCDDCGRRLARVRNVLVLLQLDARTAPSAALVTRTLEAMKRSASAGVPARSDGALTQVMEAARRLVATLVADSLLPSMAFRGVRAAMPRMLVYETEPYALCLSLSPGRSPGGTNVQGQIMPRHAARLPEGTATIEWRDGRAREALSEFGEFRFDEVNATEVHVQIALGGTVINLAPLLIDGTAPSA